MTVHYSEGSARAVVRSGTVVVLPGPASADIVDTLWTVLGEPDGGVAATLAVLAAGGLAQTPPFAVVSLSGDPASAAHVAVRGAGVKVVVSAESSTEPVEVTGADVVTWSERIVDGPTSFAITTDEAPADAEYPVQAAVVRASALRRTLVDAPGISNGPDLASVPLPADPAPPLDAVPGAPLTGTDEFPDFPTLAGVSILEQQAFGETIMPSESDNLDEQESGQRPVAEPTSPSDVAPVPKPGSELGSETESELRVESAPESDSQEPAPESVSRTEVDEATQFGGGDDYGHLFGDTVMRRVEDAAVRQDEDDEEAEEEASESAPEEAAAPASSAEVTENIPVTDPSVAEPQDGLISGVPGTWSAPTPARAKETPPGVTPAAAQRAAAVAESQVKIPASEVADHDGETMMSVDIAELRQAAGAALPHFSTSAQPGAPQILGRLCPQGHPNPPTGENCRGCGEVLESDPELVSRPSLGRILVTGSTQPGSGSPQVVELDRPVIVGRRPRTGNAPADRTPRLVTVASPVHDISRSHVEITLEEWHVLVADLATTNGTTLLRPGQSPRRLHPNEKVIVVEGDVVDLGDGATLTFEGIW